MSSIGGLYKRFRQLIHEGAKFLVIGTVGAIVTFGAANALHPIGKYKAITIATILATLINYLGNRHWTFRHRQGKGTSHETVTFIAVNVISLLIYYGCIGLVDLAGLGHNLAWYNVALVVGTGLGTLFRFWSYRNWVWLATTAAPVQPADGPAHDLPAMVGAVQAHRTSADTASSAAATSSNGSER